MLRWMTTSFTKRLNETNMTQIKLARDSQAHVQVTTMK